MELFQLPTSTTSSSSSFFFILLLLLLILIFSLWLRRWWCNCEICRAYVTQSWRDKFVNLSDWYSDLLSRSPTQTIHVHVLGNVITANPGSVRHILKSNFHNYPKGKPFSSILSDFLGHGIFNVDGPSWLFQRKLTASSLLLPSSSSFLTAIVLHELHHRLLPLLLSSSSSSAAAVDLQDLFRRFSFDTMCRFSFGLDPRCLLDVSEFAQAFDLASRLSAERAMAVSPLVWKLQRFFNIGNERRMKQAIRLVDAVANQVITNKRNHEEAEEDLLSRFMRVVGNDDVFLRDIIISFLLAGRDTVAAALTSFFWLVAKHRHVQSEILAEASRVLGPDDDSVSYEQVEKLQYLQAAVYESMRLYPPIQFDSKFAQSDDVLPDGTPVRKGDRVTYHPYAMGRSEGIWGRDCLDFKPERWLRSGSGSFCPPVNPFEYPVFQAGLRVCLGKEMALVEMKTVAVSLLRRFHFNPTTSSDDHHHPRFSPGLTATFSGGLPVLVRQRN
ncbi:unnamed protein product [Linum tenue]|uniref:Cytochrome P450 n=1 Tax=Linum tenue TaxID=586396 RepID=A0AAV0JF77_9ROSI|nr:unnamed protein product [Linum tenue]